MDVFDYRTTECFGREMGWARISAESKWKSNWDSVIIIFVLYNSIFIPFR